MAASGIAEHAEARRKQIFVNRRAYNIKNMIEELRDNPDMFLPPPAERPQSTYDAEYSSSHMRKVGSPPGISDHHAPIIDKLRREQIRQQQVVDYSAKLPGRLSSTDYTQQW
ncbi:uncharacterized protein [Haliotis cracherodii]|uniref:uncharacterized protein n=1 Tax=Haliotis cracherodii TaxID=6455 RepID=UPI0039E89D9E